MALIKTEDVDDCPQSTETKFSEGKNEGIEIDHSNLWTERRELTSAFQGTSAITQIKREPVESDLEDGDGYGMEENLDEAESGTELKEPLFVAVKEELKDETLLDEGTCEPSDSVQMSDIVKKEEFFSSYQSFEAFIVEREEEDPMTDTKGMLRDACSALVVSQSENLNCCNQCNTIGTQNLNSEECINQKRSWCFCRMNLSKGSLGEGDIQLGIASTSNVEKRIFKTVAEECIKEQNREMQRSEAEDANLVGKIKICRLKKVDKGANEKKPECPSLNSSSEHTLQYLSSKNTHTCILCERTFNKKSDLASHMRSHTGERPFKCNDCGTSFMRNHHLTTHMRLHTGEKRFKCNQCGCLFLYKAGLTKHMRLHTGENCSFCNQCGMAFNNKRNLSKHMRHHTGGKPFQCILCRKAFKDSFGLTAHMRIHTGEKPFKCSECGKAFNQKAHLTSHMLMHTGEMPFKCNECGKAFNRKDNLTVHMRQHSGEEPFKCNLCKMTFKQGGNLTKHLKSHTNN